MLYPLMVLTTRGLGTGQAGSFLWYPGAIPGTDSNGWPMFCIALVTGRQAGGAETIEWVPVIEETLQDSSGNSNAPIRFNVQSQFRGLVALRINYPYQSATLSAIRSRQPGRPSRMDKPLQPTMLKCRWPAIPPASRRRAVP